MAKTVFYHGPDNYIADKPDETLSFAHWNHPVSIVNDQIFDGNGGETFYTGFDNFVLTKYNDFFSTFGDNVTTVHGGAGNDSLHDDGPGNIYGDAGNDFLGDGDGQYAGTSLFGGAGDHVLSGIGVAEVAGGKGHDEFRLDCVDFSNQPFGTVVHDFHHGQDHITFFDAGSDPYLTHDGEYWTVHPVESTFDLVGVTALDSTDYFFG